MKNLEIMLAHGEVNVNIELAEKTVEKGWGSTYFQQKMYVTMVDSFDDITLEVIATLRGDLYPEWEFVGAKFFSSSDTNAMAGSDTLAEALITGEEMAEELTENHGFLDALTEAFYR